MNINKEGVKLEKEQKKALNISSRITKFLKH